MKRGKRSERTTNLGSAVATHKAAIKSRFMRLFVSCCGLLIIKKPMNSTRKRLKYASKVKREWGSVIRLMAPGTGELVELPSGREDDESDLGVAQHR